MSLTPNLPEDDYAGALVTPLLSFVALCIEAPAKAAQAVAVVLSLAALMITLLAGMMGAVAGAGLALLYAGSGWALSLYLKSKHRKAQHDN
ncbi:MAG: hypothetical protein V2I76_03955 [Roseobacter sp.]|jgi:hypothetical protein|nr:hypothetical protein [Roseobacter sp.]